MGVVGDQGGEREGKREAAKISGSRAFLPVPTCIRRHQRLQWEQAPLLHPKYPYGGTRNPNYTRIRRASTMETLSPSVPSTVRIDTTNTYLQTWIMIVRYTLSSLLSPVPPPAPVTMTSYLPLSRPSTSAALSLSLSPPPSSRPPHSPHSPHGPHRLLHHPPRPAPPPPPPATAPPPPS